MTKNFSKNFLLIRPMIGPYKEDPTYNIPIMKSLSINNVNLTNLRATNFNNLNHKYDLSNIIALMFKDDSTLMPLWNNPFKIIPLLQQCALCAQPDFTVDSKMNINEFRHMVYMRNWLGCFWQNYGCPVIPTPCWSTPDTYDLCFCGYEKGSIVIISTIGCHNNTEIFLNGFNEMKKRLKPSLIIVYGNFIEGMTGTFLHFKYNDCFCLSKPEQLSLFDLPIFEIKEMI